MCNFQHSITNKEITNLWKNGITYVSYIDTIEGYKKAITYHTDNMDESADALKGKHGYLCSRSVERDIRLVSWRAEQVDEFEEAFKKVKQERIKTLYETRNPLGVKGTRVDEETGETFEIRLRDRELTPALEYAGYEKWESIYTHLTSWADFSDKFKPLKPATLRPKKFKRTNP